MQANQTVLTVSQLNREVGALLEGRFSKVWVRGEISNFTRAASGHWYFTIKDDGAALRAVMFRGRAAAVGFVPKAGEQFEFRGNVTLYEPRGDYQLQVDMLRRAGRGDLHEAFLQLKARLAGEGLFDSRRKQAVEPMPGAIGVVTSMAAAALHDVLSVLARRAPHIPVIVYPAPVQGADAAAQLCGAVRAAVARGEVDVLLIVRGGGSLEDLWCFNDETLARILAACPIPVISGVGHETDFTIADFVADLRAPTPTAAAELSCASRESCLSRLGQAVTTMTAAQRRQLTVAALRLDRATALLVSPGQRVRQQKERLGAGVARMARAAVLVHEKQAGRLRRAVERLDRARPATDRAAQALQQYRSRLAAAAVRGLDRKRRDLAGGVQTLQALDPGRVLARGYALVRTTEGILVKNALDLNITQQLHIEFGQGRADVTVSNVVSNLPG
jgi:exodeoxyribonuclease VII large subunit